jgi:hypothetical protein
MRTLLRDYHGLPVEPEADCKASVQDEPVADTLTRAILIAVTMLDAAIAEQFSAYFTHSASTLQDRRIATYLLEYASLCRTEAAQLIGERPTGLSMAQ